MKLIPLIAAAALCLIGMTAQAKIYLHPSGLYQERKFESGTSGEATSKRLLLDFAGGYEFDGMGLALGLHYGRESESTTSSGTTGEPTRSSYGPSVGWISQDAMGPFVFGTYHFSSEYNVGSYKFMGWGYQLDAGYRFPMGPGALTLQLSYKGFQYKKYELSGVTTELGTPDKHTLLDPYIGYMFEF